MQLDASLEALLCAVLCRKFIPKGCDLIVMCLLLPLLVVSVCVHVFACAGR